MYVISINFRPIFDRNPLRF